MGTKRKASYIDLYAQRTNNSSDFDRMEPSGVIVNMLIQTCAHKCQKEIEMAVCNHQGSSPLCVFLVFDLAILLVERM